MELQQAYDELRDQVHSLWWFIQPTGSTISTERVRPWAIEMYALLDSHIDAEMSTHDKKVAAYSDASQLDDAEDSP